MLAMKHSGEGSNPARINCQMCIFLSYEGQVEKKIICDIGIDSDVDIGTLPILE
jgi:hypothetical protein